MEQIRAGKKYNELTETEKMRYCLYRYGTDYHPDELLCNAFGGRLGCTFDGNIPLEYRPPQLTPRERLQMLTEAEQEIQSHIEQRRKG